jgi:hypothetical protein
LEDENMRIDQAILRRVLETVEAAPGAEVLTVPEVPGVRADQQRRHLQLLLDGGYVTGQQLRPYRPAFAVGLTISGQRMLDETRAPSGLAKSVGECAQRVVSNIAVGLIVAKAHAAGIVP